MAVDAVVDTGGVIPAWLGRRARAVGVSFIAVVAGLVLGGVLLSVAGASPISSYRAMLLGAFGSRFAASQLLVQLTPLLIIGLGLSIAFRGKVWNIGAEGQFYLGALAGGAFAIAVPLSAPLLIVPMSLFVGAAAGAAWGWLVGKLRSRWDVNEVISSLLLNYVAIYWYGYFIRKPLRDGSSFLPQSREIPVAARFAHLPGLDAHMGLIVALVLVPVIAYVMSRTPFGFRVTTMGLNPEAARAAGIDVRRMIVRLMSVSGALAGLAGIVQILGVQLRLQQGISPGFGFTAIVVALLGRLRPFGVLLAAIFVSALSVGGAAIQYTQGIPVAAVHTIQALFVVCLLVGDRLVRG